MSSCGIEKEVCVHISIVGVDGIGKTPFGKKMKADLLEQGIKMVRIKSPYYSNVIGKWYYNWLRPKIKNGVGWHNFLIVISAFVYPIFVFWDRKYSQMREHDPSVETLAYGYFHESKVLIFLGKIARAIMPKPDMYIFVRVTDDSYHEKKYSKKKWSKEKVAEKIAKLKRLELCMEKSFPENVLVVTLTDVEIRENNPFIKPLKEVCRATSV